MHTYLCDVFGIEYPIFAFSHCRDVVAAVSKAGGLGVLGAVGFTPQEVAIGLNWIGEGLREPFALPPLPEGEGSRGVTGWAEGVAHRHVEIALGHPIVLLANA